MGRGQRFQCARTEMQSPDDAMPETENSFENVMNPPEVVAVETERVSCDGSGGALGHPRVWYEMGDEDFVECGYCDRRFVRKGSPADPGV